MSIPGRLTVGADGKITGRAAISYNDPFPTQNGSWGSGQMSGVLMHTMAGNLPGTVQWFNNPASQASANFGVAQDGSIWQWGPLGKGWVAWHAAEANETWYGIEHADNGNPANPLTAAQMTASAQLVECLSAFAGFPLQLTDSTDVKGLGWHGMGGQAWGGHLDCPGEVRKGQRGAIIAEALAIRSGAKPAAPASPPTTPAVREWTTAGEMSLAALAAQQHSDPASVLRLTVQHAGMAPNVADYVNGVFSGRISPQAHMPAGLKLYLPG